MILKEELQKSKKEIDEFLTDYFEKKKQSTTHLPEIIKESIEASKEVTLAGGKRIRAILVFKGYELFGGKEDIMPAAAGVELTHNFFLIHDDVMDNGEERHGTKTIHTRFNVPNKKYGESMAICMGDLVYAYANELILETKCNNENKINALQQLSSTVMETVYGQTLDITEAEKSIEETSKENIDTIEIQKTAKYTFENPIIMGALLAGLSPEDEKLNPIKEYSLFMGKAFQIQDNILGVFGNSEKTGKSVSSDLEEGKKTVLVLTAFQNASNEDKIKIKNWLGNPLSTDQKEEFKEIITKTGALDESKKIADDYVNNAIQIIKNAPYNEEKKKFFIEFAEYMKQRTY